MGDKDIVIDLTDLNIIFHEVFSDYYIPDPSNSSNYITDISGVKFGFGSKYILGKALKELKERQPQDKIALSLIQSRHLPQLEEDEVIIRRQGTVTTVEEKIDPKVKPKKNPQFIDGAGTTKATTIALGTSLHNKVIQGGPEVNAPLSVESTRSVNIFMKEHLKSMAARSFKEWIDHLKAKKVAPKKIRQFKNIWKSGLKAGKGEEYSARVAIDVLPKEVIESPTEALGSPKRKYPLSRKSSIWLKSQDTVVSEHATASEAEEAKKKIKEKNPGKEIKIEDNDGKYKVVATVKEEGVSILQELENFMEEKLKVLEVDPLTVKSSLQPLSRVSKEDADKGDSPEEEWDKDPIEGIENLEGAGKEEWFEEWLSEDISTDRIEERYNAYWKEIAEHDNYFVRKMLELCQRIKREYVLEHTVPHIVNYLHVSEPLTAEIVSLWSAMHDINHVAKDVSDVIVFSRAQLEQIKETGTPEQKRFLEHRLETENKKLTFVMDMARENRESIKVTDLRLKNLYTEFWKVLGEMIKNHPASAPEDKLITDDEQTVKSAISAALYATASSDTGDAVEDMLEDIFKSLYQWTTIDFFEKDFEEVPELAEDEGPISMSSRVALDEFEIAMSTPSSLLPVSQKDIDMQKDGFNVLIQRIEGRLGKELTDEQLAVVRPVFEELAEYIVQDHPYLKAVASKLSDLIKKIAILHASAETPEDKKVYLRKKWNLIYQQKEALAERYKKNKAKLDTSYKVVKGILKGVSPEALYEQERESEVDAKLKEDLTTIIEKHDLKGLFAKSVPPIDPSVNTMEFFDSVGYAIIQSKENKESGVSNLLNECGREVHAFLNSALEKKVKSQIMRFYAEKTGKKTNISRDTLRVVWTVIHKIINNEALPWA